MILTWIRAGQAQQIFEGDVRICQSKMAEFKKLPQWQLGYFQIRTKEGFKAIPILQTKTKKKENVKKPVYQNKNNFFWQKGMGTSNL